MTPTFMFALTLLVYGAEADVKFDITNREPGPVWVGIQGNPGHPHLNGGGFALNQGQTVRNNIIRTISNH